MSPVPQAPQSLVHRGYRLKSTLDEAVAKQLLDAILGQSYEVRQVFKDSRSTYAAHLQIGNDHLVHKIPRARLRRKWEKLITLMRDSEGIRIFKSLQLMQQLGFKAPTPLLAGEKRRNGFVVDCFCCYRFEEGAKAGPNDAHSVTTELLKLHGKGYLRSDAKSTNFLITNKGVTFIDFRLKKPFLFPTFKKKMELAHFARLYPESLEFIPEEIRTSRSFSFATWLERKKLGIRTARRRLKQTFKSS